MLKSQRVIIIITLRLKPQSLIIIITLRLERALKSQSLSVLLLKCPKAPT